MDKITFCIPSKSNLRYLKTCIPSIRKNAYRNDHEIIIFVDSDEDGTIEWLDHVKDKYNLKYYVNPKLGKELYGIGMAYDFCINKSTTDIFMIFHADMMLGKNADINAFNHLSPKTVVCSTRIEPPLHPNNGEKILLDFGMWPEEFKKEEFNNYVESHLEETKTTEGVFAPWMMYKNEFISLGGHDSIMHSCREDSDVFNRMLLDEFSFIQPWNSLVYHLTGRGAGSFDGDEERHKQWQKDMDKSTKEFIRKWGSGVKHTPLMKPIVVPKYNIGFIIKNLNSPQFLSSLEPWCSTIYMDKWTVRHEYLHQENHNTSFDLDNKIRNIDNYDQAKENDILVTIDGNNFNQQDFQLIQQLPEILNDSGEIGSFELGNLHILVVQLNTYEKELIICKK